MGLEGVDLDIFISMLEGVKESGRSRNSLNSYWLHPSTGGLVA